MIKLISKEKLGEKGKNNSDDFPKEYRGFKIYVDNEPDISPFSHFSTFKRLNQHYFIPHKDSGIIFQMLMK